MAQRYSFSSNSPTSVNTSFTEISTDYLNQSTTEIVCSGTLITINLELQNDSGSSNALDGFKVQLKDSPDGEFYDYLVSNSAGSGDFQGDIPAIIFVTNKGPHETEAGNKSHVIIRVHAASAVKILAKSAGTSDVFIRGTVVDS